MRNMVNVFITLYFSKLINHSTLRHRNVIFDYANDALSN